MSNLNNNNNKKLKTVRLYKIGGYKQNDQGEFETRIPFKTNRRVQFNDPMLNFNPYFNPYQPHSMAHYPPPPYFGSRMPPYGPPIPVSYGQPTQLIYKDSKIKKLNSNLKSQNNSQPLRFYNQYHQDDFYSWNGYPSYYDGQEDRDGDDEDDDEYDETDDTEEDEEEDDDDDDDEEEEDEVESSSTTNIVEKKNEIIQEPILVQQENKIGNELNVIRPKSTVVTKKFEIKGTTKKIVKITTANVVESPYVVSKPISKNKYQETEVLSNSLKDSLTHTDKNKLDYKELKSNKNNNPLKISETNLDKSSLNSKINSEKTDMHQENHQSKSLVNVSVENSKKTEQIESGQVETKAKPKTNITKSEIEASSQSINHENLDQNDSTQYDSKESKLKDSTANLITYHENKNEQVIVQNSKNSGNEISNRVQGNQSILNPDPTMNENLFNSNFIQSESIPNPPLILNSKNDDRKASSSLKDSKSNKSSSNLENNEKSIMNSNKIESDETFKKLENNEEISKPILNSNNSNKSVSDEAANKQLKSEIISKNFELSKEILQKNEKSVTISDPIKDFLVEKNDKIKKVSDNNDKPISIKEDSTSHLENNELVSKKNEKSVSINNIKFNSQNQATNKLDGNESKSVSNLNFKNTDQIASVDNNSKDLISKTPIQNSKPKNVLDENASKDLKTASSEKGENSSDKNEKSVSKSTDQKVSGEFDSKLENNELIHKSNKSDLPTQTERNLKDLEYKTALKNLEKLFENEIASKKIEKPINNSNNNKSENGIPNKIDNTQTISKLISNSKNDETAIKHDSKDLQMKIPVKSSKQFESIKSNEPNNNLIINKNSNNKIIIPVKSIVSEKASVLENSSNLLESENLLVSNRISPVVLNENTNTIVDKNFMQIPQVISYYEADFSHKIVDSKKSFIPTSGAKEEVHNYKYENLDKQICEKENFYEKNFKKLTEKELILPTIVKKSSSFKESKKSLKDIGNSKLKAYKNNKPAINKLRLVEKTTRNRPMLINETSKKNSNKLKTEFENKKSESIQNNSDLFLKDRENSIFFGKISKVEIPSPVSSVSPTSSSYQNLSDHDQRINEIIEENKIVYNSNDHKDLICTCSHSTIDEGECEDEIDREKDISDSKSFSNIPKLDKNTVNKKTIKVFFY